MVLSYDEVDLEIIKERFVKEGGLYHFINLGFSDCIGDRSLSKFHPEDLKKICREIEEDYKESRIDLILFRGHIELTNTTREAICSSDAYRRK